jgi:hypothetical protein
MRTQARLLAAVLVLGTAGGARAVSKGGTLYVKAKNTRLMASSAANAQALTVLQPGQPVTWLGADPGNKQWHQVEVDGRRGVVFQSNLSAKPPSLELVATAGGLTQHDAAAFANSGAAVKLLTDGPLQYGKAKGGEVQDAMGQLEQLRGLVEPLGDADYAAHAERAGLFPVVGPSDRVQPPPLGEPAPVRAKRRSP